VRDVEVLYFHESLESQEGGHLIVTQVQASEVDELIEPVDRDQLVVRQHQCDEGCAEGKLIETAEGGVAQVEEALTLRRHLHAIDGAITHEVAVQFIVVGAREAELEVVNEQRL
jgi:hypothetical protein